MEATSGAGSTPLMIAAEAGHEDAIRALVATHHANVDHETIHTETASTALMSAAQSGRTSTCSLLLELGADASLTNKHGYNAASLAALKGHVHLCRLLVDCMPGSRARACARPMQDAASNDHVCVLEMLTTIGGEPSLVALTSAVKFGSAAACRWLLQRLPDVDVDAIDEGLGYMALIHLAASNTGSGKLATCVALLDAGAQVNVRTRRGATALHLAAVRGHTDVVALLLSRGASPADVDDAACTALMHAARTDSVEACRALINGGCPLECRDATGFTAQTPCCHHWAQACLSAACVPWC